MVSSLVMEKNEKCTSCPICDSFIPSDEDINIHVNGHFSDATLSQMQDHLTAHEFEEDSCSRENNMNDSLLAKVLQEEENKNTSSGQTNHADEELAMKIHNSDLDNQEAKNFQKLQEQYGMTSKGSYSQQYERKLKRQLDKDDDISQYYEKKASVHKSLINGDDNGNTCTVGLSNILNGYYQRLSPHETKALVCKSCDHYSSDLGDSGWGCGYRNIQMLLSSLLKHHMYRRLLTDKLGSEKVPTIPHLQTLIEQSWASGYDAAGCEQLNGKLQATKKWIGTTEAASLLRWINIRARIVDFHKPTGANKTHPRMFKWILEYFSGRKELALPLYLQHQGHSRTCIGIEKDAAALLLFDPSHKKDKINKLTSALDATNKLANLAKLNMIRKTVNQIKYNQLQILFIDGIYETDAQRHESKVMASIRIP